MRALFSGVSGIRSHQVRMDVIGNNIANVNTTGFKSSRVTFMDVYSQTISAGSARTAPLQIGLGVGVASTDLDQSDGSLQLTGRELDLAIEGNGMFVLNDASGQRLYSRAGSFAWDSQGYVVNPGTGQRLQGWMADSAGSLAGAGPLNLSDLRMTKGGIMLAKATTSAALGQNLDAGAAVGTKHDTVLTAYDSLGRPQSIVLRFTKSGSNFWQWGYMAPGTTNFTAAGTLSFNPDGTLPSSTPDGNLFLGIPDATPLNLRLNLKGITQAYAGTAGSTVLVQDVDGNPMGTLESMNVDPSGTVSGVYSNNIRRVLGQVALANFPSPQGLLKSGSSSFSESAASGAPAIGMPKSGGRGGLVPGNLEMSNVDLSTEFTNMIITQRGFQANTKVITSADEMMQDLVNLRR